MGWKSCGFSSFISNFWKNVEVGLVAEKDFQNFSFENLSILLSFIIYTYSKTK
jgi:hypothetical protein